MNISLFSTKINKIVTFDTTDLLVYFGARVFCPFLILSTNECISEAGVTYARKWNNSQLF